jgi:dienelactone hydrolase
VIVMPQWNSDAGGHVGLAQLLARFGISALRLSLPYHDVRMPPELSRADYIVSSNVVRTVQVCRQAVLDARRAIDWLDAQGFDRIGILGTSLGSCLSC